MVTQSYTPLPVAKWSSSSLIKFMDDQWGHYLKTVLDSDALSREEKNKRIDRNLPFVKLVHEQCKNREINFKKLV